jgi:FtsH-binding integral membrane protein
VFEESFYKWLGWALFAVALALLFTPYSTFPWAITGLACMVIVRVIRLERQFAQLLDANQATLAELQARVNSAVRDE